MKKSKPKNQEELKLENGDNDSKPTKKNKKPKTTGSRWAALILLGLTIILSLIFKLQSNKNSNKPNSSESNGKTWEFTAEDLQ